MSIKLEGTINYNGNDWYVIKEYLKEQISSLTKRLLNPDTSWDDTNKLRGSILALQTMLDTESYHREGQHSGI